MNIALSAGIDEQKATFQFKFSPRKVHSERRIAELVIHCVGAITRLHGSPIVDVLLLPILNPKQLEVS